MRPPAFKIGKYSPILLLLLLFCSPLYDYAQSYERRWAFQSGISFVKYSGTNSIPDLNYSFTDPALDFRLTRYVNGLFDFSIEYLTAPNAHYPITEDINVRLLLADLNTSFILKGHNGFLLKETSFFSPYIKFGIGGNIVNNKADAYIPLGIGTRIRIESQAHLHFDVVKKFSMAGNFQPLTISVGLAFDFGTNKHWEQQFYTPFDEKLQITFLEPQDIDGDGTIDLQDACPLEPGLARFKGCPTEELSRQNVKQDSVQQDTLREDELADISSLGSFDENLTSGNDSTIATEVVEKSTEMENPPLAKMEEKDTQFSENTPVGQNSGKQRPLKNNATKELPCLQGQKDQPLVQNISYEALNEGLPKETREILDKIAKIILECNELKLEISTFVPKVMKGGKRKELAEEQAVSLKYYLVYKHGIDNSRISITEVVKTRKALPEDMPNLQIAKLTFLTN